MTEHIEVYNNPSALDPLFPTTRKGEIDDLVYKIIGKAGELKATIGSEILQNQAAGLVRNMNSYYSNLIEGHRTLPRDIERALEKDYSSDEETKRNQLLSAAHVETERELSQLISQGETNVFGKELICWIHRQFYEKLPKSEWKTRSLSGKEYPIKPGEFRNYPVKVGTHTGVDHNKLEVFLKRFESGYSEQLKTVRLLGAVAAHHRLVWIHPFGDGNGRVARLQTQAVLMEIGLDCGGLWTLSRGLARRREDYMRFLQKADQQRINDYDRRGNLTDRGLADFSVFMLETMLGQLEYMIEMFDISNLQKRIEKFIYLEKPDWAAMTQKRAIKLLKQLSFQGKISRGEIGEIVNLKPSAARELTKRLLEQGLIHSKTEKGPIQLTLNSDVSEYYFPKLYIEM